MNVFACSYDGFILLGFRCYVIIVIIILMLFYYRYECFFFQVLLRRVSFV